MRAEIPKALALTLDQARRTTMRRAKVARRRWDEAASGQHQTRTLKGNSQPAWLTVDTGRARSCEARDDITNRLGGRVLGSVWRQVGRRGGRLDGYSVGLGAASRGVHHARNALTQPSRCALCALAASGL